MLFSLASSTPSRIQRQLVHAEARRRGGREIVDDAAQAFGEGVSSEDDE